MNKLLVVLGIVLVIIGILAAVYTTEESILFVSFDFNPFSKYAIPLLIAGIVVTVIGVVLEFFGDRGGKY